MDDDLRTLKSKASFLIASENSDTVSKGAELLKSISEIESQSTHARKIEDEMRSTHRTKEVITLLVPLATTLVLAGTLVLQSYQFSRTEHDKDAEAQRERDAAEDASWGEALKLMTGSEKLDPAVVLLKRFVNSPRYAEEAQATAVKLLLLKTAAPDEFQSIFGSVFVPIKWATLSQIVDIDRELNQQIQPLLSRAWVDKTHQLDWRRASKTDKSQYDNLNAELDYISNQLAVLLKGERPPSQSLDFHSIALWDTDLQHADLSGADLTNCDCSNLNLTGANLSAVAKFGYSVFWGSAWWESSQVSPQLLAYLEKTYPVVPGQSYASGRQFTKDDYETAVAGLRKGKNLLDSSSAGGVR